MKIIKINLKKLDKKTLNQAVKIIQKGGVVAFPCDTCYGLAADATNQESVEKVFKIKQRPFSKPISVIIQDLKIAQKFVKINKFQYSKLKKYLPGPYTIILSAKNEKQIFTKIDNKISIRIPKFNFTNELSKALKIPYTATSANISNQPPAWSGQKVIKYFKNKKFQPDLVLDAGVLNKKPLSTIIDLTSQKLKTTRRA